MTARADSAARNALRERCEAVLQEEEILREGGGKVGQDRQRKMGRLPARERIAHLLDRDAEFFELGLWAAYKMYEQWGSVPAAGAVAGIGNVAGIPCMIIANDATVKAGAFFPADRQEADPRATDRLRMRAADHLSGRFLRRFPPDAGRNFSG